MTWRIWQILPDWNKAILFYRLNQSKNSKQAERLDAVWKHYYKLEINE